MRRIVVTGLSLLVGSLLLNGCKTVTPGASIFEEMQNQANGITDAGGLAAVAVGTSRTMNLALEKARTRGRAELARILETKISSLQKDFTEEIGEGEGSEYNSLFSTATKTVTSRELRGSVPKALKYEQQNGQFTAYALMVLDPKVIADALADQANTQRALYTRFRASQAFGELDAEVKKYDEFKKEQMGTVIQ